MIRPQLLELLRCPETRMQLRPADEGLVARLNRVIAAGRLCNVAGAAVTAALECGLVREDGRILYPVLDGIPRLLVDEGISLAQLPHDHQ